jgi:hypothetical protein
VLVDVDADGTTLVVDGISPDGTRRRLAEIDGVERPDRARVSPCGHLAVHSGDLLLVVDMRDPDRRILAPGNVVDGADWDVGRDGRLTLIDDGYGNIIVLDPRDGSITRTPWNGELRTYSSAAWDGSGWRAEVETTDLGGPPQGAGIVEADGTFRRSAVLVFDPLGFLWWTRADGAIAWPRLGGIERDVMDVYPPGGRRTPWRLVPAGRQIETWLWDAAGEALWILERQGGDLHVVRTTGPGEATDVTASAPIPAGWYPVAVDAALGMALLTETGLRVAPTPLVGGSDRRGHNARR